MSVNPDGRPWPQTLVHDDLEWPTSDQRVLVPFHEAANLTATSALGGSIAFGTDGELYLLHAPDSDRIDAAEPIRSQSEAKLAVREQFGVPVTSAAEVYSSDVLDSFVSSHSITTTVVDEDEEIFLSGSGATEVNGCHTLLGTGMDEFESPASILVPVSSGPHSGLATRIAQSIARAYGCWIELFHVIPDGASREVEADANRLLDAYEYRLDDDIEIDHHVYEADDPAEAIVEHSEYHSVTILGAPQKGKLRRFIFGSTTDEVKANVGHGPVLTAHRDVGESALTRWL